MVTRWLLLACCACHAAPAAHPAVGTACNPGRVGKVTITGAPAYDVAPLAVLEGTLDDAARTERIANVAAALLRARGWRHARIAVERRDGCGTELLVAVDRGPHSPVEPLPEPDAYDLDDASYDDPALASYVQSVADRLARGALVPRAPRILISDRDGTYAAPGDRIVIGRLAIEKLGSEAELAGIVAHELAHVEGDHAAISLFDPDEQWLSARRDAEAVADERAVALLERAGYAPAAMARALRAELDDGDDDEHPSRADRLARVDVLTAGAVGGFEGRNELLSHTDRMVIGRDTRLGVRVGRAWVVAQVEVALDLRRGDTVHERGDTLELRHGASHLTAYAVSDPSARELAAALDARSRLDSSFGEITVGVAPKSRGKRVVVVDKPRGGLVLEVGPRSDPYDRDRWLSALRPAEADELDAAQPRRLALHRAPHDGLVRELVRLCPDDEAALGLDDPNRLLAEGDLVKCTDR